MATSNYNTFDAQARNPQPFGTYRDTPEQVAARRQRWGQPNISPLSRTRKMASVEKRAADGAFRR